MKYAMACIALASCQPAYARPLDINDTHRFADVADKLDDVADAICISSGREAGCQGMTIAYKGGQIGGWTDGTYIAIPRGTIQRTTPDELAFVIAHEMAHNLLPTKSEREADVYAVQLVAKAGYDPLAGAALLRRVTNVFNLLSFTHPNGWSRARGIERAVSEMR